MSHLYGAASYDEAEVIPPILLPEMWIAYSGLDIVAIPLDTFAGLPGTQRSALLDWVHTGGSLVLYNTQETPGPSSRVDELVGFEAFASRSEWQPADPSKYSEFEWPPRGEEPTFAESSSRNRSGRRRRRIRRANRGRFRRASSCSAASMPFRGTPFPARSKTGTGFSAIVNPRRPPGPGDIGFSARQGSDSFSTS